jgi:hypothetical protein
MSQIQYSGIVADNKGKLGGTIFQGGHSGNIVKRFTRPYNPQSAQQQDNRVNWQYLVQRYSALPPANIAAWVSFAKNYTWYNKLKQPYKPTGQLMYCSVNTNLFMSGAALINMPVTPTAGFSLPVITVTTLGTSPPNITCHFLGYTVPTGFVVNVYATNNLSPGIAFAYKSLKLIGLIPAGTANTYNIVTLYTAMYSYPPAGRKTFYKFRLVEVASGFASPWVYAFNITGS